MNILFVIGIIVVILTIIDIFWSTLWVDGGAGFITNRICKVIWIIMSKMARGNKDILKLAGPVILTITMFNWIILLWLGWTLVFASDFNSIVNTAHHNPIIWEDFMYYAGSAIFTLGNGDYAPASPLWQTLTNFASGSGMLFVTLGASYITTIVSAVMDKRSFASSVFALGNNSEEIILQAWNGKDFSNIDLLLINLSDNLSPLSIKHKAYPLLHFYHASDKNEAIGIAIPMIDNALLIIEHGIEKEAKPNPILLKNFRNCVESYLNSLEKAHINPSAKPLDLPDLNVLRKEKLPVLEDNIFEMNMKKTEERRKKLLGLLSEDGWKEDDLNNI